MEQVEIKIVKLKEAPVKQKPKTGISYVIENMAVLDSFTIEDNTILNTSVYNAIKHVRNYKGRTNLVVKSIRNADGTRTWWRKS